MEKKKILVVDDEHNSREGLTKILIKEGYDIVAAESGEAALKEAAKQDFDLIITDLKMPDISGIEVLEKIREKKPNVGVIIVTAYGEVNSYLKAMTLGAFEYLNKPIKLDELRRVINKALGQPS
ncbi:response regulator [bacterium]|nr:response regulator [bacterium]